MNKPERLTTEILDHFFKEKKLDNPENAKQFLIQAGIIDTNGDFTEPYQTDMTEFNSYQDHLEYIKEKYSMQDNPKFNKAYGIAYEWGHAHGFNEVELIFQDLLDLIV